MPLLNVLTLEPQEPQFVAGAFPAATKRALGNEARRLDIVIDGRPLRRFWREWEQVDADAQLDLPDLVTMLSRSTGRWARNQLSSLRGAAAGERPCRAELFYCPVCFDVSDGILTVEIARTGESVVWKDFGWRDEYDDGGEEEALLAGTPVFTFDATAYDVAIEAAAEHFSVWRGGFNRPFRPRI
ncbi:hypothetical protein [Paeniglutamicibacter kerguelensis]|uniref:Uncharacterized protein n=1 Tax=Paeniglutamicibacter kerguelensis TaxID=254788 RepID=A0ABS4XI97_9MICC|nr:hypothetical protein [Paeniglutamicibacter kerguelensis]MBP2388199.1 hypothetical protein [Paeniglutamicibacter kerguelensis]